MSVVFRRSQTAATFQGIPRNTGLSLMLFGLHLHLKAEIQGRLLFRQQRRKSGWG